MTYIIIGDSFTFPEGDAATNRVYTYAKGFAENGVHVHVFGFRNDYLTIHSGEIDGIRFHHPFKQTVRHKNLLIRRMLKLRKYLNTINILKEIDQQDQIEQITVYTTRLLTHLFSWYLTVRFKAILIKESSEHPLRLFQDNIITKIIGYIKFKSELFLCDGIICISHFLIDFHIRQGFPEKKLLLVPSTVDPSRFFTGNAKPLSYKYIGYFGALTFKRDNVDLLIKAFAHIYNFFPDYHLVLGGPGTDKERYNIKKLAENLKVSSRVELLNYLPRNEIAEYIIGSEILVMTRRKDMESQASFPSKLTEYLATSKPLITVNVGEIGEYLFDGENSFVIEPEDEKALAEKLKYVIENYDLAKLIAQKGSLLTKTIFNYNYQARRIIHFISTLT